MTIHIHGTVLPAGVVQDIFVSGDCITFQGTADADTILDGGYLIPGLVDAHAHLSFASPAEDDATWADKARASAMIQLEAGVLVVRDPGGVDRAAAAVAAAMTGRSA